MHLNFWWFFSSILCAHCKNKYGIIRKIGYIVHIYNSNHNLQPKWHNSDILYRMSYKLISINKKLSSSFDLYMTFSVTATHWLITTTVLLVNTSKHTCSTYEAPCSINMIIAFLHWFIMSRTDNLRCWDYFWTSWYAIIAYNRHNTLITQLPLLTIIYFNVNKDETGNVIRCNCLKFINHKLY